MKSIFIVPFFGKLPKWFNLYLLSCEYNTNFNWLILTNDTKKYTLPPNVEIKNISFEEVKKRIIKNIDTPIKLKKPYKLCDFRPAFGLIFNDFIEGYDYWGHTDLDVIYGDLSKFISLDKIKGYSKIQSLGHLTLYKNDYNTNRYFLLETPTVSYKEVFNTDKSCYFDEKEGIGLIYKHHNIKEYNVEMIADISTKKTNLTLVKSHLNENNQVFIWEKGNLFGIYKDAEKIKRKEYEYIHFQKRDPKIFFNFNKFDKKNFLLNHEGFFANVDINSEEILKYSQPTSIQIITFQKSRVTRKIKWLLEQFKWKIKGAPKQM